MKPKLNKFMSFTPENLEMIGTKIQKTHKKKQLMEFKKRAFDKARNKPKKEPSKAQNKINYIYRINGANSKLTEQKYTRIVGKNLTKSTMQPSLFENANISNMTPMMAQYMQIKQEHMDYLLFYRMGDFYELFFDDAVIAADVLDIVLTKRGKHENADIPMCGVPYHSHENYLHKLIKAGHKVAICEQMESPDEAKKRGGYKAVVKREVVRIITPGTIVEENLLNPKSNNYMAIVAFEKGEIGIAYVDISTGQIFTSKSSQKNLHNDLNAFNPSEILVSDKYQDFIREYKGAFITNRPDSIFNYARAEARLKNFYNIKSLSSMGGISPAEITSLGVMLEYLNHTQKEILPLLGMPKKVHNLNFMAMDRSTMQNLELFESTRGDKKHSLFAVIDKTKTATGARLLNTYLAKPLASKEAIANRQDAVQFLIDCPSFLAEISDTISFFPDIERSLARVCTDKGRLKDLGAIRDGIKIASIISEKLLFSDIELPSNLKICANQITNFGDLSNLLSSALVDELPVNLADGHFIKKGFSEELDNQYEIAHNSSEYIIRLRDKYREETGINNLKISQNNVIGYFVDVTPSHAEKINTEVFKHKQTLASSVRYTTAELMELEAKINECSYNLKVLENNIFRQLCENIIAMHELIGSAAQSIASIDVYISFANLAKQNNFCRPKIHVDETLEIEGGRHPCVEQFTNEEFIKNDCNQDSLSRTLLITGPNMGGKSTYLRQNALIIILAQMGSFVPADSASIGVVDAIYSRIGASDDISSGQSTFMVEMLETATIINSATSRSFVILDEIGRGTATYDGLSIAWAILEDIVSRIKCRALFATHYHELTDLESKLEGLKCLKVEVKEYNGKLYFLHKVAAGKADRSYGVHVAELAGIPKNVTARASNILDELLKGKNVNIEINSSEVSNDNAGLKVLERINSIDVNSLSPKEAFDILYELKLNNG